MTGNKGGSPVNEGGDTQLATGEVGARHSCYLQPSHCSENALCTLDFRHCGASRTFPYVWQGKHGNWERGTDIRKMEKSQNVMSHS